MNYMAVWQTVVSLASFCIEVAPPLSVSISDICYLEEKNEIRKPMDTLSYLVCSTVIKSMVPNGSGFQALNTFPEGNFLHPSKVRLVAQDLFITRNLYGYINMIYMFYDIRVYHLYIWIHTHTHVYIYIYILYSNHDIICI